MSSTLQAMTGQFSPRLTLLTQIQSCPVSHHPPWHGKAPPTRPRVCFLDGAASRASSAAATLTQRDTPPIHDIDPKKLELWAENEAFHFVILQLYRQFALELLVNALSILFPGIRLARHGSALNHSVNSCAASGCRNCIRNPLRFHPGLSKCRHTGVSPLHPIAETHQVPGGR